LRKTPDRHRTSILIFDGDCGFCTWSVQQTQRWIRPRAEIHPWQNVNLKELGLTQEQCSQAVQWVTPTGEVFSGGRAVSHALQASPLPWSILGRFFTLPGVRSVIDLVYRGVAANRYRLPGATPACASGAFDFPEGSLGRLGFDERTRTGIPQQPENHQLQQD
jgi:predicted DCC family thiol-disulfide oxidoreductase YuxK